VTGVRIPPSPPDFPNIFETLVQTLALTFHANQFA
jgi:hypothetical protein